MNRGSENRAGAGAGAGMTTSKPHQLMIRILLAIEV